MECPAGQTMPVPFIPSQLSLVTSKGSFGKGGRCLLAVLINSHGSPKCSLRLITGGQEATFLSYLLEDLLPFNCNFQCCSA